MGPLCSSAETQVCHRSYIIAANVYLEVRKRRGNIFYEWNKCLWAISGDSLRLFILCWDLESTSGWYWSYILIYLLTHVLLFSSHLAMLAINAMLTFTNHLIYGSWIYNYLCNQWLSPLVLWVRIPLRARCTTLCDKVCQWLAADRWFSTVTPVFLHQ